jgi:hypothetical protein
MSVPARPVLLDSVVAVVEALEAVEVQAAEAD